MDPADHLSARLDALEMRAMQQDQVIEDLDGALAAQWRVIDSLQRQVAGLQEQFQELGKPAGAPTPEPPPPHY